MDSSSIARTDLAVSHSDDVAERFEASVARLQTCTDLSPLLYDNSDNSAPAVDPACEAMAQTVGTLVARLDQLNDAHHHVTQTPREALLGLVDAVRHALCLSLQHYTDGDPSDTFSRETAVSRFNAFAAVRQVPIEAVVEGLYSVGYVSTKLRLEKATWYIQRRLEAELHARGDIEANDTRTDLPNPPAAQGSVATHDSSAAASTATLHVTLTLLQDFRQLLDNTLRLLDAQKETGECSLPAALREYYRLTDWILLAESATQVPAVSFTTIHKVEVDLATGEASFTVRRVTGETPWGLLFNDKGRLIDVDVSMRSRKEARDLHQLLRCATEGARVVAINETSLRAQGVVGEDDGGDGEVASVARRHGVLMALRAASQGSRKRMRVTIQSPSFTQDQIMQSHVAGFAIPFQGHEWAGGQRAMIVLQRLRPNAPLPVTVDASLRLVPSVALDGPAGEFVSRVGDRARVLAVNGVEVFSLGQAQELMAEADTVMLTLVMTTPGATEGLPLPPPLHVTQAPVMHVTPSTHARLAEAEAPTEREPESFAVTAEEDIPVAALAGGAEGNPTAQVVNGAQEDIPLLEVEPDDAAEPSADAEKAVDEVPLIALTTQADLLLASKKAPPPVATRRKKAVDKTSNGALTQSSLVDSILQEFAMESKEVADAHPTKQTRKRSKTPPKEPKRTRKVAGADADLVAAITADVAEADSAALSPAARKKAAGRKPSSHRSSTDVCAFENGVKVLELTNKTIVLERPSTKHPWGIEGEMATHATDFPAATGFRITKLPSNPLTPDHAFLRKFDATPPTWYVAGVNKLSAKGKTGDFVVDKMRQLKRMTLHIIHK